MADKIYECPICHVGWHETPNGWERVPGKGQHFKDVQRKACPDCAKKDFIHPDPASRKTHP